MPFLRTVLKTGSACLVGVAGAVGYGYFSGSPWVFDRLLMPAVRFVDPERAHVMAVLLASKGLVPRERTADPDMLNTSLWGQSFSNPIGLAAGFDKHAEAYEGLLKMGFGFVEVGSVTPLPQEGNDRPRVFRLEEDRAVINRYGFNSHGHAVVKQRLTSWTKVRERPSFLKKLVGVNLGKNKMSLDPTNDYVQGMRELGRSADYIVINVSSPNTPGLRDMQGREQLEELLNKVSEERNKLPNCPPLLVKIAPDLTTKDKEDIASVVTREKAGADGLIISNTTISRPSSLRSAHKSEGGGLSGEPLKDLSTQTIRDMYLLTGGNVPIIGVGGVSSGKDAYDKMAAGASLVQVYSALSYEGPPVISRIKIELADIMKQKGQRTVSEVVGSEQL